MWGTFWQDIRSPRRVTLLLAGIALAGVGIGILLSTDLGVSPIDAVFAGTADRVGFSVGTAMIVISVVMVIVAWLLGTPSGVGTAVCFVGIGVFVDVTSAVIAAVGDPSAAAWPARVAVWLAGGVVLGLAAAMLNACGLGASAYDQFVRAFTRWGLSLHRARLAVDFVALLVALLLGGAIGVGTVGLLVVIPVMLKLTYPPLLRWVAPTTTSALDAS